MNSKRKLLISMLAIVFVLLAVVATVAIAFALTQQTITTTLNIGYVVEDIDGTASATYTIGGVTESLTAKKGNQVIGDTLVFHAGDTEDDGNLMFPEGQIPLSAQNDNIVIQYTYSNTGAKHYIASMSFDGNISADNMKVEYSIDGTTYSENRYAVVVPANTNNKSYWIKISIENKAKSASFTGDFNWLLSGCDTQEDSYLSLTSVEMQSTGTAGSYQVSLSNSGSYVGELVFPRSVNGDPVRKIVQNTSLTQEQKNQITSVYISDSVETIDSTAFMGYENMQNIYFEQNGLKSICEAAFVNCDSLQNVVLPEGLQSIATSIFADCDSLISIYIPASVTSIGGTIALRSQNVKTIEISSENPKYSSVGNCIIDKTTKTLQEGINTTIIPDDANLVTTIGSTAFYYLEKLTTIVIPDSIISLEGGTFAGCSGLKYVTIGSGVQYMMSPFADCAGLVSVTFNTQYDWYSKVVDFSTGEQVVTNYSKNDFLNPFENAVLFKANSGYSDWYCI